MVGMVATGFLGMNIFEHHNLDPDAIAASLTVPQPLSTPAPKAP